MTNNNPSKSLGKMDDIIQASVIAELRVSHDYLNVHDEGMGE